MFLAALTGIIGGEILRAAEPLPPAKEPGERILSISVEPKEVLLRGENRRQQLLITAQLAEGRSRDVTHLAAVFPAQ